MLPPKNNGEAESRKRPPRRSSWSVNVMPSQVQMGFSRERHQMERTPEHIPAWLGGAAPPLPFRIFGLRNDIHPVYTCTYRCLGTSRHAVIPIRAAYDGSHGFTIPPFTMYDGSFNAYDHMMHFNQEMILSAGNDCLLCKVFPASLKGPALA